MWIIGIDPGKQGAFVFLGDNDFAYKIMPLDNIGEVDFNRASDYLIPFCTSGSSGRQAHIYLERAKPMAMGSKHAFNYGRDFAKIEIAIKLSGIPVTYVEPTVWSKVMHEGISKELTSKVRSRMAVERLFPKESKFIPKNKNGKLHDGVVEALLIAGYGQKK